MTEEDVLRELDRLCMSPMSSVEHLPTFLILYTDLLSTPIMSASSFSVIPLSARSPYSGLKLIISFLLKPSR